MVKNIIFLFAILTNFLHAAFQASKLFFVRLKFYSINFDIILSPSACRGNCKCKGVRCIFVTGCVNMSFSSILTFFQHLKDIWF